jgi:hypothetical protein
VHDVVEWMDTDQQIDIIVAIGRCLFCGGREATVVIGML